MSPLYAGLAEIPLSDDPVEVLWRSAEMIREHHGTRGWDPGAIAGRVERLRADGLLDGDRLTADGRALRDRIEDATDRSQAALVGRLGDDVDDLLADLTRWSQRCLEARA